MVMEPLIDLRRDRMRKLFVPGPVLLALTSLANFEIALPTLINVLVLAISIPATLIYIFTSWQVFSLVKGGGDAGSGD